MDNGVRLAEQEEQGTNSKEDENGGGGGVGGGRKRKAACIKYEEENSVVEAYGVGSVMSDAGFLDIEDDGGIEVDEAMLAEVMRKLEYEINGNTSSSSRRSNESCGSSFSDSSSTVMASIDTRGVSLQPPALPTSIALTGDNDDEEEDLDDFFNDCDEWLPKILDMDGMQFDEE